MAREEQSQTSASDEVGEAAGAPSIEAPAAVPEVPAELEVGGAETSAVVPTAPPGRFQATVHRFLQRAMERLPRPAAEVPSEIYDRIDGLQVQVAALEELIAKRLEEVEGRTLHLMEKRIAVLQEEVGRLAARAAEREVAKETRPLRAQVAVLGGLAIGLAAAALLKALGVF